MSAEILHSHSLLPSMMLKCIHPISYFEHVLLVIYSRSSTVNKEFTSFQMSPIAYILNKMVCDVVPWCKMIGSIWLQHYCLRQVQQVIKLFTVFTWLIWLLEKSPHSCYGCFRERWSSPCCSNPLCCWVSRPFSGISYPDKLHCL